MSENVDRTISTYASAVEDFRKSATEFMQHVTLLGEARDAYQKALSASDELRSLLESSDKSMQTLMGELERVVNLHLDKFEPGSKKVESMQVKPIRA